MTTPRANPPNPTELRYDTAAHVLHVTFDNEERFSYSAEFLRVHSPSAEVRGHGPGQEVLQVGKERVGIEGIEPVGNYAVRLRFDDGHDTGLYSWEELHWLGSHQERLWNDYLERLRAAGHQRRLDA